LDIRGQELSGEFRKLRSEELHNLYPSLPAPIKMRCAEGIRGYLDIRGQELSGEFRKLRIEELHNMYPSLPAPIEMRCAGGIKHG